MKARGEIDREARRVLVRLLSERTILAAVEVEPECKQSFGIFSSKNGWRRPVLKTTAGYVSAFVDLELLTLAPPSAEGGMAGAAPRYRLSRVGETFLRRHLAPDEGFAAQHRLMTDKTIEAENGTRRRVSVNSGETPLGWLRHRKGQGGEAFLNQAEFEAGERLREDFTKAGLTPRTTADWSLAPGTAPKRSGGREDHMALTDVALAARQRFHKAIEAAGPGLGEVLIEVCCLLHGLEDAERGLGWPKRSAKVVLKIALGRLAEHYGLVPTSRRRGKMRSWKAG